jgi:putative phosphonoacetaldehyde dehydrogenase
MQIGGQSIVHPEHIALHHPFNGQRIGSVPIAKRADVTKAISSAHGCRPALSKEARVTIMHRVAEALDAQAQTASDLITLESGLCKKDTLDEVARAVTALNTAAGELLRDDGELFTDHAAGTGEGRRILTHRTPLLGVIAAVTPFNHPLNQVAHKLIPAVATNNRIVLKPSEKAPLSALFLANLFYEAGYPPEALSVVTGNPEQIVSEFLSNPDVEAFAFTGSADVGKRLAERTGFRRAIFELGGNDTLIVMDDADLDQAASLALRGAFRNSGQRCTAVKRVLVHDLVANAFLERLVSLTEQWTHGDPFASGVHMGTLIDTAAAVRVERRVQAAIEAGARLCIGHRRQGALYAATVLDDVPTGCELVMEETFGPVAPIMRFHTVTEAIAQANGTRFGLAAGICTQRMDYVTRFVAELQVGMINIGELPSYRSPQAPFGGVKDSGLGMREGIRHSMRNFTNVKCVSLPWSGQCF